MKFYKYKDDCNYWNKIKKYELTAIYYQPNRSIYVQFFKNGKLHNAKNASYVTYHGMKAFNLNGNFYGNFYGKKNDFTKESWRRFVKLQAFL